jgi:hypothetical protein
MDCTVAGHSVTGNAAVGNDRGLVDAGIVATMSAERVTLFEAMRSPATYHDLRPVFPNRVGSLDALDVERVVTNAGLSPFGRILPK